MMGEIAVMLGSDVPGLEAQVMSYGPWVGVGLVRLDERPHVHHDVHPDVHPDSQSDGSAMDDEPHGRTTDLTRVLDALETFGPAGVAGLVGDFAFVAWNRATRQLIAARDAFGVRRLYMALRGETMAFSTRASLLTDSEEYDMEYFAEFLLHGDGPSGRTAFKGVDEVRSAETVTWTSGTLQRGRYWEPPEDVLAVSKPGAIIVEEFSQLLFDAVRSRLSGERNVWSHLSGGMDSSSVVGVAETLARRGDIANGLIGVVTYQADAPLGGDVDHARMVAAHYGLRHEILDRWRIWDDDGCAPPLLDQPAYEQANYAVERRMANIVAAEGGQVLLTGIGGDLYLRPQFEKAADLLAHGSVREAIACVSRWAIATRQSFWKMFAQNALYPLLPSKARYALGKEEIQVPRWISSDFARRFELRQRATAVKAYNAPWGSKARAMTIDALFTHASRVGHERVGEINLEWRHPFFHRPLVEYGLRLPDEWVVAPGADLSKRVLREAMKEILPEPVRLRRGKGGMRPEIRSALKREASRLGRMAIGSKLGELGCLDPGRLASAVKEPSHHERGEAYLVNNALTLESWLGRRENGRP
jgi:asparagine synthase (glutamine-hydrolysing)